RTARTAPASEGKLTVRSWTLRTVLPASVRRTFDAATTLTPPLPVERTKPLLDRVAAVAGRRPWCGRAPSGGPGGGSPLVRRQRPAPPAAANVGGRRSRSSKLDRTERASLRATRVSVEISCFAAGLGPGRVEGVAQAVAHEVDR